MPSPVCKPCLGAALAFAALAALVAQLAIPPLGAADLLGIAACSAAAGAFATLAFVATNRPAARPDTSTLRAEVQQAVADAFAAETARRQAEIAAAFAATPPAPVSADALPNPRPGEKSRLGRGLLGLMHAPSALAPSSKPPTAPPPTTLSDQDRAAA